MTIRENLKIKTRLCISSPVPTMAGFNDRYYYDSCFINSQAQIDNGTSQYNLNLAAALPNNGTLKHAPLLARGSTPSFWGPFNASKTTKDSYLTGRAQPLSKCPSTDVVYLPESLFGADIPANAPPSCYSSALEGAYDRQPRSCQSVTEIDVYRYNAFPGAYQKQFAGVGSVANSFVPSRMAILDGMSSPCGTEKSAQQIQNQRYSGNYSYV